MNFRNIEVKDVKNFLERANSNDYIDNLNLCDFYDEYDEETLINEINNLHINQSFVIAEIHNEINNKNEIIGYTNFELIPQDFFILSNNEVFICKVCYLWTTCSFSRWRPISHLSQRNVGNELWNDLLLAVETTNQNDYTVIFTHSTEYAKNYHKSHGMRSSKDVNRFIFKLHDINGKTPYDVLGLEEYDKGEMDFFVIVRGAGLKRLL